MKSRKIISLSVSLAFTASLLCYTIAADVQNERYSSSAYNNFNELSAPVSYGLNVLAYDNPMILSGKTNTEIGFSAEVFNDYNGYVPASIKVLSLPDPDSGILTYNSKSVTEGQSISILSLKSLSYNPTNSNESEFFYSTDNMSIKRCIIKQFDRDNNNPITSDSPAITTHTRLDTCVSGYLDGYDSDGDNLKFEIVSAPSKGIVSVIDQSTGQFVYHPYNKMNGEDKFSYRVMDTYGAYSGTREIPINISNTKAVVYNDISDSYYASAVNDVVSSGLMQISKTIDEEAFNPAEPVSRIDFLVMAMKAAGAGEASEVSITPFEDDSTLSGIEKGYLSAAYKLGIVNGTSTNGKLTFTPEEPITGASAAVILNSILGLDNSDTIQTMFQDSDIPAWAAQSFNALTDAGIINNKYTPWDSVLSRENVAVILSNLMHRLA